MRAILIDPETRTVTEVNCPIEDGGYKEISRSIKAALFTCVGLNEDQDGTRETLYVDDEGLLNEPEYFFQWRGYPQPLAGRGLILGTDGEGETIPTKIDLDYARDMVSFVRLSVEGFVTSEHRGDSPLGPNTYHIITTPVFGPPKAKED